MIIGKKDTEYVQRLEMDLERCNRQIDNLKTLIDELEKQNKHLVKLISLKAGELTECKVGPWCDDCIHKRSIFTGLFYNPGDGNSYCNAVSYCAKHIHELCPEWEPENRLV